MYINIFRLSIEKERHVLQVSAQVCWVLANAEQCKKKWFYVVYCEREKWARIPPSLSAKAPYSPHAYDIECLLASNWRLLYGLPARVIPVFNLWPDLPRKSRPAYSMRYSAWEIADDQRPTLSICNTKCAKHRNAHQAPTILALFPSSLCNSAVLN